ncbi:MAG: hypothetical protein FWE82_08980 [Defluviitaleaceae bacterium]|nr:hypothetical protein [Defluviitaleaceae bacterium]
MTSRERIIAALQRKPTDRVPFSGGMGINHPVMLALTEYAGFDNAGPAYEYVRALSDIKHVGPRYVGPKDRNFTENGVSTDMWGVKRGLVYYAENAAYAEICHYPLGEMKTVKELADYVWPTVDWFDFSVLPEQIKNANTPADDSAWRTDKLPYARKGPEYAIMMGNGNIFETSWYMRGFQDLLTDLLAEPEIAEEILTRVTNFYVDYFTAALTVTNKMNGIFPPQAADGCSAPIDLIFTADDIGQQEGLLTSLELWEKMIKPHHKRLNNVLHKFGVKIVYHSDGAVMDALDGLIDMGIDVLEALQFDAKGMSPDIMKQKYGDRLCFHGGVSVQHTLPYGTPEEVRNETAERIRVLGNGGGYILATSHAVQAGTPVENLVEFLKFGAQ